MQPQSKGIDDVHKKRVQKEGQSRKVRMEWGRKGSVSLFFTLLLSFQSYTFLWTMSKLFGLRLHQTGKKTSMMANLKHSIGLRISYTMLIHICYLYNVVQVNICLLCITHGSTYFVEEIFIHQGDLQINGYFFFSFKEIG